MGYSQETGYIPTDIDAIMLDFMDKINVQFNESYTAESFVGTNHYKYFYAIAQLHQQNEIKTSEIFAKLQQYFVQTNEKISRPVVTNPGTIEEMEDEGFITSVKPMIEADAGKKNICVDVDDGEHATGTITVTSYANLVSGTDDSVSIDGTVFTAQVGAATPGAGTFQAATSNAATAASLALQINSHATTSLKVKATAVGAVVTIKSLHGGTGGNALTLGYTDNDTNVGATKSGVTLSGGTTNPDYAALKLEIATLISQNTVGGVVTQGLETQTIVLSNGQSFDYKYWLPNRLYPLLRLTTTLSENNEVLVGSPDAVKATLIANIAARYRLGRNFEPQRYFSLVDAPWASQVVLEYSLDNGGAWSSAVYNANFDDLFEILLENITLVEA